MRLSDKFAVPEDLTLLYDFVNTLDVRHYVEHGAAHVGSDDIDTPARLEAWLRARGLLEGTTHVGEEGHRNVLALRAALRSFFALASVGRCANTTIGEQLTHAAAHFPLALRLSPERGPTLEPAGESAVSGLSQVLAEVQGLANSDRLDRVKMCASDECGWIFFDRSKPANRRWCSSARCGNREKTRTYRGRRKRISGIGYDTTPTER